MDSSRSLDALEPADRGRPDDPLWIPAAINGLHPSLIIGAVLGGTIVL